MNYKEQVSARLLISIVVAIGYTAITGQLGIQTYSFASSIFMVSMIISLFTQKD